MKKIITILSMFLFAFVFVSKASAGTPLITNGGFEFPVVSGWDVFPDGYTGLGWDVSIYDSVQYNHPTPELEIQTSGTVPPVTAYEGNQYTELDSYGSILISEDIPTTMGCEYTLNYAWTPRPGVSTNNLKVYVGGSEVASLARTASGVGSSGIWNPETYTFTALTTSTNVGFSEGVPSDQLGMFLDGVTLNPVLHTYYHDGDSDTYGDPTDSVEACIAPEGYVEDDSDCDDTNAEVNPGGDEICNGVDDNCNTETDEDLTAPLADKQDGVCKASEKVCGGTEGWVEPDYTQLPDYEEEELSCDTLDNDCNGAVDSHVCNWYCSPTVKDDTTSMSDYLGLGTNRFIWTSGTNFTTMNPKGKEVWSKSYTLSQTNMCSCSQILSKLQDYNPEMYGDMLGHWKYGCSQSVMNEFIGLINPFYRPLTGTWLLSVNNGAYKHDMVITLQDEDGDLTGTGGYKSTTVDPLPYEITWALVNSSVTGNSVDMTLDYNSSSYTAHIWGTITPDWNSMSGGAGTGGVTSWSATRVL